MDKFDIMFGVLMAKIIFRIMEILIEPISPKEVNIISISKKELEDLLRKMEEDNDQ